MEIKQILVGTDFSDASEVAMEHALAIADRTNAKVMLVNGNAADQDWPKSRGWYREYYDNMLEAVQSEDRSRLATLCKTLASRGVPLDQLVVNELPANALQSAASDLGADLVCVGSRGMTGVKRVLLGSVAEKVVKVVPSDVLVARGEAPVGGGYHRVLIPTDFSDGSYAAARRAVELADPGASQIDIIHFWKLPAAAEGYWAQAEQTPGKLVKSLRELFIEDAIARGHELIAELEPMAKEISFKYVESDPLSGIERCLQEGEYDLVAVGGNPPAGIRSWFTGSVALSTVRLAPCTVLVARPKTKPETT